MEPYTIVGILVPTTLFISAVGFLLAWRWAPEMKHSRTLAICYCVMGIAFLTPWIMQNIAPREGLFLCGTMALGSTILLAHGVFQRFGQVAPVKTLCALLGLNMVMDYYTLFAMNDLGLSLKFSSTTAGVMLGVIAWHMRNLDRRTPLERMVPLAIIALGTFVIIHPLITARADGEGVTIINYPNSFEWISVNIIVLVLALVTAMTLISMIVSDITNRLQSQARTDTLSGLPRRGVFEQDAEMILKRANRSPLPIAMITCDIDYFKSVNDKFGHLAGDVVIAQLGSIIGKTIRATDAAGRLGGEEFGIILWNANAKSARLIAEQLRTAFEETEYDGLLEGHHCTASFGIAQYDKGESYKSLFARADRALYHAKDSGRNRVVSYETHALAA